jgi:hypothetical protein
MDQNKIPDGPRHVGVSSDVSQTISESGTFGANHTLSYVKISTISKWTNTSFHLSLVT